MFLDSIFSLFAILLLAFSLYKLCGLNASVTPFVTVTGVIATVSLLSLVNLLAPADVCILYVNNGIYLSENTGK